MRIHIHTICWNDRPMLDYFFRNYEQWVDRFLILDDGSTDGTLEYLAARPDVDVRQLVRVDPTSWVLSAKAIYDHDWKRSCRDADWVVITNIDEHLHHQDMRRYLARLMEKGVTIAPALGYQMFSQSTPTPDALLWRDCPIGAPWAKMSKIGIFRPGKIEETSFAPGRHTVALRGDVALPHRDEIANLHYKYVWGLEATQSRHAVQKNRLGVLDQEKGWGHKYSWSLEELQRDFEMFADKLTDTRVTDHHVAHSEPRWWRNQGWKSVDVS